MIHNQPVNPLTDFEKANDDKQHLINKLIEANLSLRRFLKVDDMKRAFEREWQNNLYTPEELTGYQGWGISAGEGLVLLDADNTEIATILRKVLPQTFEVLSPRRKMPHFYYRVIGKEVQNCTLYVPETFEASHEDWIHDISMEVLKECSYAIFEVTFSNGHLMEIERVKDFKIKPILVYQIPKHGDSPTVTRMLVTAEIKKEGYRNFDELTTIIKSFLPDPTHLTDVTCT